MSSVISVPQYDKLANETMENLYDALEALVEEWSPEGSHGWEIEYSVSHPLSLLCILHYPLHSISLTCSNPTDVIHS